MKKVSDLRCHITYNPIITSGVSELRGGGRWELKVGKINLHELIRICDRIIREEELNRSYDLSILLGVLNEVYGKP